MLYTLIFGVIVFTATASLPDTKFSRIMKIIMDVPADSIEIDQKK
jgi:hypothetical protein